MALAGVITAIQDDLRADAGLAGVRIPDEPVDQINQPILMVYPGTGFWRLGTASRGAAHANKPARWGLHTIRLDLLLTRKDLPFDVQRVQAFEDVIPHALLAGFTRDRFGDTVVGLGEASARARGSVQASRPLSYEFTEFEWGGMTLIGYRYELDVEIEEDITV